MKKICLFAILPMLVLFMLTGFAKHGFDLDNIEIPFEEHYYSYTDNAGYQLKQTLKISPWISEYDEDLLSVAWKEVSRGREFPTKGSMGISNGRVSGNWTHYINYDEVFFCVGSITVENLTPGFHLSSTDNHTVYINIGDAKAYMAMQIQFSSVTYNYYSRWSTGGGGFTRGSGNPIAANMVSDKWGPVPFVIAMPIDRTPNNPDGSPSIYDCEFDFGDDRFILYQYNLDMAIADSYEDGIDEDYFDYDDVEWDEDMELEPQTGEEYWYVMPEEERGRYVGKWLLQDNPDTFLELSMDEYSSFAANIVIYRYGQYLFEQDYWGCDKALYLMDEYGAECTLCFHEDTIDLEFVYGEDDYFTGKVFTFIREGADGFWKEDRSSEKDSEFKEYDPDGVVVVSMGDSYSSGEGIPPFYGQNATDRVHNNDWLAHRSENSWHGMLEFPGLSKTLADHRGELSKDGRRVAKEGNWYFVASSGAETTDFYRGQEKKYNVEIDGVIEKTETLPPQLSVFSALKENGQQVDYVLMTLGGNDLGFSNVLTKALGGKALDAYDIWSLITKFNPMSNVEEMVEEAKQNYQSRIRNRLKTVYLDVWEATDRKATIIIAGYPKLFGDNLKGLPETINKGDVRIINDAVVWFNKELFELVEECRLENPDMKIVFVGVTDEFRGYEAYSHDDKNKEYLNRYMVGVAMPQDLILTLPYSAYSMHPNKKGAQAYARAVQRQISNLSPETAGISVGDTVFLGSFEQDNDVSNGQETIEWVVLDTNVDKALLLSKYGLEMLPYNTTDTSKVTWYGSRIREWLNHDFWESAFTPAEKAAILTTTVDNSAGQGNDASGGENTHDKLFLLSYREYTTYDDHLCVPTAYSLGKGAWESFYSGQVDGKNPCLWWLRSPSKWESSAELVYGDDLMSFVVSFKNACVRPAMWVDLDYFAAN